MKSSKTKQAKRPGTPKARAAKQSAVLKAKRAAAARALASKKLVANKSSRRTKTKTAGVTRRANSPVATKPVARKKALAARAAPRASNTIRAAKKGATRSAKPVLARATGAKRGASVRANAKSVSGKTASPASVNKPARGKPAASPKKTPAIEVSRRVPAKPAATVRTAVESPTRAAQNTAASKSAAAAILALKRNAARLSEARKQAASPPASRPAGHSSKLDLDSKEWLPAIKKSEQEISTASALGPTDAIDARVPPKGGAAGVPSQAAAKGSGKPFAAKTLGSQRPPSMEGRPGARAPARLDAAQTNMADAKPSGKSVSPTHKPAKTAAAQRQMFKPHEYVVYPAHGVGQIVAIEEQEVAGFKLELFVVRFVRDKMILKVPTPKAASVGMRRLADAPALKVALDTLTGRARVKRTMWSRRAQEYEAKINSGDLKAIAEVVRDLYRSDTQPEQSYSERQLYETALDRMAREILVVQKLTETESLKVIETQLQKGPRRGKTEESEAEEAEIEQAA
ncbi:MAG: CarD family transcriptional regulator [Methylocella sp.]|nr:MAG: CarD family transcriptional regulator [Hyphomicrobiales bacterium]